MQVAQKSVRRRVGGLRGDERILGNPGRVDAPALPIASFPEGTDRDEDTHICETFINVSVLERLPCRDDRSAPPSLLH
jgi:hypothetical protein